MTSIGLFHPRPAIAWPIAWPLSVFGVVALWLALAAFATSAVAADESPPPKPKTWHSTSFGKGRSGFRILHYWSRGSNLRSETLIAGHPVVTIVRGDRYYVLDMLLMKGAEIRRSPAAIADDKQRLRPFANELDGMIRDHGEKIGEETMSGVQVEIWRATDSGGRRTLWVTASEPKVPVRIETFDRQSGDTMIVDYADWLFDLEIPDAFFDPPAGFNLETYEYADFVAKSLEGGPAPVPIFYPQLLHGTPPR